MEFNKFDIILIFTMSLAIVIMSFAFPALGMTDESDEQGEGNIPDFNISSDRFDFAGEFPDKPGTPSSGLLKYDEEQGPNIEGRSLMWIDRPKSDGTSIELQNGTLGSDFEVVVTDFNSSAASGRDAQDRYTIQNITDQVILHDNTTWVIEFSVDELEDFQEPTMTAEVEWEILESATDAGGGLSAIPVLGPLFDTGEFLFSMLGYLGDIILWGVAFAFELALNLIGVLVDVSSWTITTMHWLMSTYAAVVSGATGFASVFVAIPGLLLTLELGKIGMIVISLLPFT